MQSCRFKRKLQNLPIFNQNAHKKKCPPAKANGHPSKKGIVVSHLDPVLN